MTILPIEEFRESIVESLSINNVLCISGGTGSGKSTMVPQYIVLHSLERQERVRVLVSQPRRVAAIEIANRISSQIGADLGERVHYKVGLQRSGDRSSSNRSLITVATAGYILKYLSHSPTHIRKFTHLILDEVHERDLDMDLLCLVIKKIRSNVTSAFKLIFMSATLQQQKMIEYFAQPGQFYNEIFVGTSPFPVRTVFLEDLASYLTKEKYDRIAESISTSLSYFKYNAQRKPHVFVRFVLHMFALFLNVRYCHRSRAPLMG